MYFKPELSMASSELKIEVDILSNVLKRTFISIYQYVMDRGICLANRSFQNSKCTVEGTVYLNFRRASGWSDVKITTRGSLHYVSKRWRHFGKPWEAANLPAVNKIKDQKIRGSFILDLDQCSAISINSELVTCGSRPCLKHCQLLILIL